MKINVMRADITTLAVDAIVNAANREMLGGGGVDGAIHRAAGPRLLQACRELRTTSHPDGLLTGDAVAVPGFDLPAQHVILTVGPLYSAHPDGGPDLLASCYTSSLDVADDLAVRSIAFPAISTGVYGWPAQAAAQIAVAAMRAWAERHPGSSVQDVTLVAFSPDDEEVLKAAVAGA